MSTLRERLALLEEEILLADGFDDAFIGVGRRVGQPIIAVYDRRKCIDILVERDGLSAEEAEEHFDFNVSSGWVGEQTPLFLEQVPDEA